MYISIQKACTHTHIHMHRSVHVYTHRNMQAYSQKHAYIYTPRSIYTCTHTHRSMDTDHAPQEVCTYTHMHEFTEAGARACAQTQIQAVMHIHNQHLHTQGPLYLHRPPPLDSKYTLTQPHTCIVWVFLIVTWSLCLSFTELGCPRSLEWILECQVTELWSQAPVPLSTPYVTHFHCVSEHHCHIQWDCTMSQSSAGYSVPGLLLWKSKTQHIQSRAPDLTPNLPQLQFSPISTLSKSFFPTA